MNDIFQVVVDEGDVADRIGNREDGLGSFDDGVVFVFSGVGHHVAVGPHVGGNEDEGDGGGSRDGAAPGDDIAGGVCASGLVDPTGEVHLSRQGVGKDHVGGISRARVGEGDGVGDRGVIADIGIGSDGLGHAEIGLGCGSTSRGIGPVGSHADAVYLYGRIRVS